MMKQRPKRPPHQPRTITLSVTCNKCKEVIKVTIDKKTVKQMYKRLKG